MSKRPLKLIYCGDYRIEAPPPRLAYVGIGHTEGHPLIIVVGTGKGADDLDGLANSVLLAVNNHAALVEALEEAERQLQYLRAKFGETGSGNAVLARIDAALAAVREGQPK